MAGFNECLHPYQVCIHVAFRVSPEELRQCVTDHSGKRAITELNPDCCPNITVRLKVNDACVSDDRSIDTAPGQEFVRDHFSDLRRPFNRHTGWPGYHPM